MWIVVESGPGQGRAAQVTDELLIGSADSCDLSVQGQDVSARHAMVRAGQGTLTLTDLDTPAGTFINGERLAGSRAVVPGDRIRIGDTTLGVALDAPTAPSPLGAATAVVPAVPTPPPTVLESPAVETPPQPPGRRRGPMVAAIIIVLLIAGIAVALAAGGGNRTPARPAPPKITTLSASATSPIDVDLSWASTGDGISGFTVTRDGTTLATVSATATSYEDITVRPKKHYVYTVEANTSRSGHSSTATSEITMPPPPPLKDARLSGRFDVHTVFLQETYENKHVGEKEYTVWALKPRCTTAACRVGVRTFSPGQTPTILAKVGTTYKGKGTDLFSACGSNQNRIRTSVAIDIKVTSARYVDRVWRATRFSGFLSRSAPSAFNCLAASSRLSVSGQLQGP